MRSILLLPLVAKMPRDNRCIVCIWRMFCFYVCCSDCGGGLWECLLCSGRC